MPRSAPPGTTHSDRLAYKRWLRALRAHLGLTHAQLARQILVHPGVVAHWCSDSTPRIPMRDRRKRLMQLATANRFYGPPL